MELSELTNEETFLKFCAEEFPDKITRWAGHYCFVQAGTIFDDWVHYEFGSGKVHLHIEGDNWRGLRNHLRNVRPARMSPSKWWRKDCQWTYDRQINSEADLYDAFREIRAIMEYHILVYEATQPAVKQAPEHVNDVSAKIITVAQLLTDKIRIPHYQRPYRWDKDNVYQLLDDVAHAMRTNKEVYRIGSIILHNVGNDTYDVVDGQQRLTTISLILKVIGTQYGDNTQLTFNHNDSFVHIKENHRVIRQWLADHMVADSDRFADFLLNRCEIVRIVVANQSEAFQMFDSQNGRGKELEAYNLLKAYHIGTMQLNTRDEKIDCDVKWESATQYVPLVTTDSGHSVDVLKQLFDEQLYRSRRWALRKRAGYFTKKQIGEFKGFTIDKNHLTQFPFQNPQLLQFLTAKFYASTLSGTVATASRFANGDNENIDPFTNIHQPIVNGLSFFSYVQTYVELYKRIFIDLGTSTLADFKRFYYSHCLHYDCREQDIDSLRKQPQAFLTKGGAGRSGDTYLRELYKSLVLCVFDRFGERGLMHTYRTLYRLVYANRLKYKQVRYATVDELPHDYFAIITTAKDLADLYALDSLLARALQEGNLDNFNNIDTKVINFIKTGK